ncbi:uncharacterized protein LOC114544571 isoform X1 [Dendronephthya gigantea]|uniref:uncharacterized protein LOC114544571 isoform X1 n=1 Tax=Dendronephthya gigantea TaxID=151771 RepID=UPI00106A58B9|nr:uncharacterized protein LOC114544571 isoform X1 [Dendronephthya gigantea]
MMTAKIFVLIMMIACSNLSEAISVFSRSDNVESIADGNPANNSSTNCSLKIDYQNFIAASLKDVFQNSKNGIRLNVRMESFKNKTNLTDVLPGLTWANKIGRTLISLITAAENNIISSFKPIFFSSFYTSTLDVGLETLDIVVAEMTEGCLSLSGKNVSDLLFSFLLHQLYPHDRVYDYHYDYELCVWNKETYFNCCRLLDQAINCSDFSSKISLTSFDAFLLFALFFVFIMMYFPVIIGYLRCFPKERTTYKVSDSPMSLSSIIHMIFIDGHGPVKSFGRKLVVLTFILLTTWLNYSNWGFFILVNILCLLSFLYFDVYQLNKEVGESQTHALNPGMKSLLAGSSIRIIALPFNLKFWRNEARRRPFLRRHFRLSLASTLMSEQSTANARVNERTRLLSPVVESQDQTRSLPNQILRHIDVFKYCLSIFILLILYLLIAPSLSCFVVVAILFSRFLNHFSFFVPQHHDCYSVMRSLLINFTQSFSCALVFTQTSISLLNCFILSFYLIAGLYLNAGHYSTYFVPFTLVFAYSWSNWKSSVETKYLELNTNIYKFSKENSILVSDTRPEIGLHSSDNDSSQTSMSSDTRPEIHSSDNDSSQTSTSDFTPRYVINLDKNGEPFIPKPLYDIVRETLLPYDEILFPFFVKVLLVVLFAYYLFLFLSLSQSSGVTSNAKILTTMVATSIPFLFDVIWAKSSDAQKTANDLALESKLKCILKVCAVNKETEEIQVEFIGDPPTDPMGYPTS